MANAIKKLSEESGKPPIVFSLCQWGRVRRLFLKMIDAFAYGPTIAIYRMNHGTGLER